MVLQHSLFCNVFYPSFSFKQFANVSLSYWSPKTHKLTSPAPGVERADFTKKITVAKWQEKEQVFEGHQKTSAIIVSHILQ